jgi:UDP-galactopyranose mutase
MKHYEILIVGAGLYGCTIAERLNSAGYKVLVIDKRDRIGGNCASVDMNGIDVHLYGPHVFHTNNKEVWNYINQFGEFRQFTHKVLSNYKGNVYNFPINRKTIQDFENNEKYTNNEIYNAFFKEYSEKQWNCKFEDVPVQALKRIPFRNNYNDSYFNDYYQGIPVEGYNTLFEKLLEGIDVELNTDFFTGHSIHKIIYTGPIDSFFNYYYGKLDWRSLRFEFKELNQKDFQGISVMHYPEKKYDYTRITEFKHFNPFSENFSQNYTVYAEEYPCTDNENPYYPIENEENITKYLKYFELAQEEKNLHFAGRLGTYKYNDMDVTVKNALTDSEKIIRGKLLK